jgi:uncharacterized cupin superfamily protein
VSRIGDLCSNEYDVERGPLRMLNLGRRLRAELLGATVFQVEAGTAGVYHVHHANEEWLIVLEGRPTLRTPAGERQLRSGHSVVFPRGAEGAHAVSNYSAEPARWVVFSTMHHPDVAEYPDAEAIGVIVGDAPTPGRDAPFEAFFERGGSVAYGDVVRRSTRARGSSVADGSPK